jgi:tRNA(Ile)-lysidine synthase TilS/MesJ
MRICKNCVLPETFPGLDLDGEGICRHCRALKSAGARQKDKGRYRARFEGLLKSEAGRGHYDALVAYSGGKDSSYVLCLMKEDYGLRTLAVTFDNGFLPERTHKNIRAVTRSLGVDHVYIRPDFDLLAGIFRTGYERNIFSAKSLTRSSTICTACIAFSKFGTLRRAIEQNIPFVAYGWSPGQIPMASSIMKNTPSLLGATHKVLYDTLLRIAGHGIDPFFLEEKHVVPESDLPTNISPLAFLDYDEAAIRSRINRLGWIAPTGVDANSTNCLLNALTILRHKELYGYHPYAFELAKLVREGMMSRADALERLERPPDPEVVAAVRKKLGL